ncbi:MAG: DNA/RNA nuclease SfsA [Pseudomonadota bacterium]
MIFDPPLIKGTLIKRYKRFLADIILEDGREITASVPNTGSMLGLTSPGSSVWLSVNNDGKRKYPHALQLVEADGTTVGINTHLPNRLTEEAIRAALVDNLAEYESLRREQKYGQNSRIDFLLEDQKKGKAYVEVKNVHFTRRKNIAEFPDTVTERGAKHLRELSAMAKQGHRAIMIYLIQRDDFEKLQLCRDLDADYCQEFDRAVKAGVEAFAIRCQISPEAIVPEKLVPIDEPML